MLSDCLQTQHCSSVRGESFINLTDFADLSPCNMCETKADSRISECFSKIKMKTEKKQKKYLANTIVFTITMENCLTIYNCETKKFIGNLKS